MDSEIITALISGFTTLLVAMGTWHFTSRKDRAENKELIMKNIQGLKDDITSVNATVQQQIAIIDLKIVDLTKSVEKHNNVIERTYKLEQESALHTEQIKVANNRISDLERHEENMR